jgi:hypothetical protein
VKRERERAMKRLTQVRCGAAWELALAALIALVAAVVLDRTGPRGGEFFVGMLLGLGLGLAGFAYGAWRRERSA